VAAAPDPQLLCFRVEAKEFRVQVKTHRVLGPNSVLSKKDGGKGNGAVQVLVEEEEEEENLSG